MTDIRFWTAVKIGLGFTVGSILVAPLFLALGWLVFKLLGVVIGGI